MASVELTNLKKAYGSTVVISDISFNVNDGEFTALVGPSGCGKSTLLRMIAGLETVSNGDILIDSERVNDRQPKDRDIAMVFQNYALYPNKTVAANIGFPLKMSGMPKSEIRAKVVDVAEALGLDTLLGRYPRQLSGGQRQRVAMGRAVVRNPKVFLFDEPLSNLDAKLRVKMRAEIKELHQRLRTTMIYVTHDQVEAMTMADNIVVLRDGHVEQVGAPLELYDNPVNKFVASFIGSPAMNFIEGHVGEKAGSMCFTSGDVHFPLPAERAAQVGAAVTLGMRPEHIGLTPNERPDAIAMEVGVIEPTGAEATFVLRSGPLELVVVENGRHQVKPGDTVWISPSMAHMHFFDQDEQAV